jgi:2-polyprenyl-3-methyl-5-hydroxy-6-metoxy-1,4-benzoquinol methylase
MSNLYEFVRYPGKPVPQTHPDRLATIATLFGLAPRDITRARVLEIGCCDGGNIIPMAMALPQSGFVGIDLTASDIAFANETASALGLSNAAFHVYDLMDLPGPFGQFDYIIVHGLYAWVPLEVRDRIMEVVKASLSPCGIAYISFNSMPGGRVRLMVRDMMLFHVRGITDPAARIESAREFLRYLRPGLVNNSGQKLVLFEVDRILKQPDHSIFHDELNSEYHPVYFYEFAANAQRCGLQYLSEATYFHTNPETASPVHSSDAVVSNQYLDFILCTYFHQSLLCHQEVTIDRNVDPQRLKSLWFLSPSSVGEPDEDAEITPETEAFVGVGGSKITTRSPIIRHLMHAMMDAYPAFIFFNDLPGADTATESVCNILLTLLKTGLVSAHVHSPDFCRTPGERPLSSPLARRQLGQSRFVTNLRHYPIVIRDEVESAILPLLDGTRTREDLLAQLDGVSPARLDEALRDLGDCFLLVS